MDSRRSTLRCTKSAVSFSWSGSMVHTPNLENSLSRSENIKNMDFLMLFLPISPYSFGGIWSTLFHIFSLFFGGRSSTSPLTACAVQAHQRGQVCGGKPRSRGYPVLHGTLLVFPIHAKFFFYKNCPAIIGNLLITIQG